MRLPHYPLITEFFDCYSVSQARSTLNKIIKYADGSKSWQGSSPSDPLFFIENIEKLIQASFSLTGWYDERPAAIIPAGKEEKHWSLTEYKWYCGRHVGYSPWHYFPRHLSKKEYSNPYRVLEKFTKLQSIEKWNETIKNLLHYALSTGSIEEYHSNIGILQYSRHLNKLIEATHLIEVRTNTKKYPTLTNKKNKK